MMRLHCDKCDKVIEGIYYNVDEHSTGIDITGAFSKIISLCTDCYTQNTKDKGDLKGECSSCKHRFIDPCYEPCKMCAHAYQNFYEPMEGNE